jgi:ABC-type sugar transport system ATPase subunit
MNLVVERGSIHALVGESGAGKSTLTKVLAGIVRPDRGIIEFDGKTATIDSPNAARKLGIGVVLQQPGLFPERPVLANLFVNREPLHNGLISRREMEARSRELLRQLGLDVDVHAPLGDLGPGERQLVAVARALLENPRLLLLDDPNSALDQRQSERLFAVLRGLKARGHEHALRVEPVGGRTCHRRPADGDPQRPRRLIKGAAGVDNVRGSDDRPVAPVTVPAAAQDPADAGRHAAAADHH